MGDHHPCRPHTANGLGHLGLGAVVEGAGGLVQEEDLRLGHHRPGDEQTLALAAREGGGSLGHEGVHLHRHGADIVGDTGDLRCLPSVVHGEGPVAHDVGEHVSRQQPDALRCHTDLTPHRHQVEGLEILAVVADNTHLGRFEAEQYAHDRGLARPGGTHHCDEGAGSHLEGHVVENRRPVGGVAEADVAHLYRPGQMAWFLATRARLGSGVEHWAHALVQRSGLGHEHRHPRQPRDRRQGLAKSRVEGEEGGGGHGAGGEGGDRQEQRRGPHGRRCGRERGKDCEAPLGGDEGFLQAGEAGGPLGEGPMLGIGHPQLAHPVHELHGQPEGGLAGLRLRAEVAGLGAGEEDDADSAGHQHDQSEQAEAGLQIEGEAQIEDPQRHREHGCGHRGGGDALDLIDGHHPPSEGARGVAAEEPER